jgi:hypothetical protein
MIFHKPLIFNWYARLGSNQRLSAPEADALSTELRARIDIIEAIYWKWRQVNLN